MSILPGDSFLYFLLVRCCSLSPLYLLPFCKYTCSCWRLAASGFCVQTNNRCESMSAISLLQRRWSLGGSRTSLLCIWQRIDSFLFAADYFPPGSVQNKNIDLFCTGKEQITRINITTGTLPCSVGVWERGLLQYATGLIRLCVVLSQALYVVPSQEFVQNLCDVFKNQTWMVLFVWSTS
jgi:hypothetical protein